MSNERCPYCIEFYDGFMGCCKDKGHEGPHRATLDDGSECGSDPDDWLPDEIAHKVDFQYINQLLRENHDTRKERDEACQDLQNLQILVGQVIGLRDIDFADGEYVEEQEHALWQAMRKTIRERDEIFSELELLKEDIDENLPNYVLDDGTDEPANDSERIEYAGDEIKRLGKYIVALEKRADGYTQKNEVLRRQIGMALYNNHRRNVELDALHYVWCDGGCEGGTHRYRLIAFPLENNEDEQVTCTYCALPGCDLGYLVKGDGRQSWCGVHSKCLPKRGPITQETVDAAIRNTERLVEWFGNKEYKIERGRLNADQKNLLDEEQHKRWDVECRLEEAEKAYQAARDLLDDVFEGGLDIEHDDGCPEDDTCECPIIERFNNVMTGYALKE